MKITSLLISFLLLTLAATSYGAATPTPVPATPTATPTPITPTPSPSVTPTPIPDYNDFIPTLGKNIALYADWSAATTDAPLKWNWSNQYFTVPVDRSFIVDSVKWSCMSACTATLEWQGDYYDVRIDKMEMPLNGQGSVDGAPLNMAPPWDGMNVILTIDQDSTGTVRVNGKLK